MRATLGGKAAPSHEWDRKSTIEALDAIFSQTLTAREDATR